MVAEVLKHGAFATREVYREFTHTKIHSLNRLSSNCLCKFWGVAKNRTTPYHPHCNGVVERGSQDLVDALHAILLREDDEWDIKPSHIMKSIRVMPYNSMGETHNFFMWLPDQLVSGQLKFEFESSDENVLQLSSAMQGRHRKLRNQQQKIWTQGTQEPPLFQVGGKVRLLSKKTKNNKSAKLLPLNLLILFAFCK